MAVVICRINLVKLATTRFAPNVAQFYDGHLLLIWLGLDIFNHCFDDCSKVNGNQKYFGMAKELSIHFLRTSGNQNIIQICRLSL